MALEGGKLAKDQQEKHENDLALLAAKTTMAPTTTTTEATTTTTTSTTTTTPAYRAPGTSTQCITIISNLFFLLNIVHQLQIYRHLKDFNCFSQLLLLYTTSTLSC